jgi:hypothetical protein
VFVTSAEEKKMQDMLAEKAELDKLTVRASFS